MLQFFLRMKRKVRIPKVIVLCKENGGGNAVTNFKDLDVNTNTAVPEDLVK